MGEEEKRTCRTCKELVGHDGSMNHLAEDHVDIDTMRACRGVGRPTDEPE